MSTDPRHFDVAIVGGGMVGASLALALTGTRLKVLLIEAIEAGGDAQPSFDDRTTALGNGARRILDTLGVWPQIAEGAGSIRGIHVSDAGHFGFARLEAAEHELRSGWCWVAHYPPRRGSNCSVQRAYLRYSLAPTWRSCSSSPRRAAHRPSARALLSPLTARTRW
jgi:hypothetical protein